MSRMLVTGASSGLGLLTVQSLVEQGHEVVLHARAAELISALEARTGVALQA